MKVKITPSKVIGTIAIPASKSISHRAIICASLAQGKSTITNLTFSKDIEATISCMRSFGAKIEVQKNSCIIEGCNLFDLQDGICCDCNESGSTLRFLIPAGALSNKKVTYLGKGRLLERPMGIYQKIFDEQKMLFEQSQDAIQIQGKLQPGHYQIDGNISSQFISGLLFVLPLLDSDSTLTINEPYESRSYVDLTLDMLKCFGIEIKQDKNTYYIKGNQKYIAHDVKIEGDYSQMAFFGVLAGLNSSLTCSNMNLNSVQGDKAILDILASAGCSINSKKDFITIHPSKLQPKTIDLSDCPDLGPILCVLASYCEQTTTIINAQRLRMKESDRIEAMEVELKKWNVDIQTTFDTITIHGKSGYSLDDIPIIDSHNDHRIVMAMCVFGLCANTPCIIENAQAITKSYPDFFEDIQRIGGKVEIL